MRVAFFASDHRTAVKGVTMADEKQGQKGDQGQGASDRGGQGGQQGQERGGSPQGNKGGGQDMNQGRDNRDGGQKSDRNR